MDLSLACQTHNTSWPLRNVKHLDLPITGRKPFGLRPIRHEESLGLPRCVAVRLQAVLHILMCLDQLQSFLQDDLGVLPFQWLSLLQRCPPQVFLLESSDFPGHITAVLELCVGKMPHATNKAALQTVSFQRSVTQAFACCSSICNKRSLEILVGTSPYLA